MYFWVSFHLTISFQVYNVMFSEYHEILGKILRVNLKWEGLWDNEAFIFK